MNDSSSTKISASLHFIFRNSKFDGSIFFNFMKRFRYAVTNSQSNFLVFILSFRCKLAQKLLIHYSGNVCDL